MRCARTRSLAHTRAPFSFRASSSPPSVAGAKLLEQSLEACSKAPDCEEVYLHVQVGNDEAVNFYKGFGFEVGEVIKDYYQRLDPNDAHLISKKPPFVLPKS